MIGLFDSGVGGFSVLRKIRERAPHADIFYFADIKHVPYGNKSRDELTALTIADIEILLSHGIKQIISACNSTSQSIAQVVRERYRKDFDYIEMTAPTIDAFRGFTKSVLIVGTQATIDSEIYQKGLSSLGLSVGALPIPALAGAIEHGEDASHIHAILEEAFKGVPVISYGTVLLACTHYPLALEAFRNIVPDTVTLFDPAVPVATEVIKRFQVDGNGTTKFLLSADSPVFRGYASNMIFRDAPIEILS